MGFLDTMRAYALNFLQISDMSQAQKMMLDRYSTLGQYASGQHKRQLKVKPLQADDNIAVNFIDLIIERSVSMLYGEGIEFDTPGEGETPQADLLDLIWWANKQEIFLHRLGQYGATYGTNFVKIIPEGRDYNGQKLARLIALHPAWCSIVTDPEDNEQVNKYVIQYVVRNPDGTETARKEETIREAATALDEDGNLYATNETNYWEIVNYKADRSTGGQWREISRVNWPYPFAPIVHWQNLPNAESCYGVSDIEQVIDVQDRYNFVQSNNSKIIRYHAHPKTWARGLGASTNASWGADEMIIANGQDAQISNLEMQSDLASSRAFALDMRQALFDVARTVDLSSIADKIGSLTNFGLRVLYMDALNKNRTKRQLYGEGLTEINRRLLQLAGYSGEAADPGEIVWPDVLPVDEVSQSAALTQDLSNGLVSKKTASTKRGYEWDEEEKRMTEQQTAGDNVGAAILRAFSQGQ